MKKQLFYIIILLSGAGILLFSCSKYYNSKDDLGGNLFLRGRAFFYNNLTGDASLKPFGALSVRITGAGDTSGNYIFSTNTDSNGYYLFNNLKSGTPYRVFASGSIAGLGYSGSLNDTLSAGKDSTTLLLYPDTTQNGLAFAVQDSTGAVISNCTCCVYNSALLARQDSCQGSLFQLVTNTFGKATTFNLHGATTYYTHCQAKFANITLNAFDTSTVGITGITQKKIVLHTGNH